MLTVSLRRATLVGAFIAMAYAPVIAADINGEQPAGQTPQPAKPAIPGSNAKLSGAELEDFLAPIALYPDTLLANVLASSVYPDQVKAAGELVARNGTPEQIDAQPWEPPVKAVARVPDAIKMMNQYADWTKALGEAYILQSKDVMDAVQRLRSRAQANGALTTTPQQTVTTSGDTIVIQPAQPDVVYVPSYNPSVVYVDDDDDEWVAGVIGFGAGIACGAILANMDCDWHGGWCSWGHGDVDVDINNNFNRNTNINNIGNNNNIGNRRPGDEGGRWQPNKSAMNRDLAAGRASELSGFRGAGAQGSSRIPNRAAGAKPIAQRPAPRPSANRAAGGARPSTAGARPAAGAARPTTAAPRSATNAARPTTPARPPSQSFTRPSSPATQRPAIPPSQRSSTPSRSAGSSPSRQPSAFNSGSRSSGSRSAGGRSGGGRSGGGGGRGGGGRGGGGRR